MVNPSLDLITGKKHGQRIIEASSKHKHQATPWIAMWHRQDFRFHDLRTKRFSLPARRRWMLLRCCQMARRAMMSVKTK